MTEQMAVEHIRNLAGDYKCWDDRISREESLILCNLLDELEQYRALGTVEELRAARDKQVAKKPKGIDSDICPNCGTFNSIIPKRRNAVGSDTVYCWHCGQAVEIKRN